MNSRKLISVLLVLCMIFLMMPVAFGSARDRGTEGPYTYYVENDYAVICDYDHSVSGELVIPQKLGGYQVGGITRWKFQYDDKITSLVLPDGFLFLGELAFASCSNLRAVKIPDSLCGVGRAVFSGTPWYNSLVKDGDFYIGNVLAGISESSTKKEVTVKQGTTGIADYLFNENKVIERF